jgi:hypothetical protein
MDEDNDVVPEPDPEFSELIRKVVHKELPVCILGTNVYFTTGPLRKGGKILNPRRNDLCPCGSKVKYKKCCININQELSTHD